MKKLAISILLPAMLLAYQPADPPHVPTVTLASLQPQPVFWPLVIGGAAVVGGAGFLGIKLINGMLRRWEHHVTNSPQEEIVFTFAEDEYPE